MDNKVKHNIIRVAVYIFVPIIYAAIGIFTVCTVFKPYIETGAAVIDMLEDAPQSDDSQETLPSLFDDSMLDTESPTSDTDEEPNVDASEPPEETVDGKTISSPTDNTKYGVLEIPSLKVKADLYFGDSKRVLALGVGQSTGSFMPGNGRPILIAGHNNTYFHLIGNLKEGDTIKITTYYGVYVYEVTGYKLSTNTDKTAYDIGKKEEELILYTCYPFNMLGLTKQRWFVYAKKVSGPVIVY